MKADKKAHGAQIRAIDIYTKRPDRARVAYTGVAEVGCGLTCTFEQGEHAVVMDMPDAIGGDDRGPSPGFFGRAAIAGCLAVGIKMAATRERVCLDAVRVRIEQNLDNRGVLAMPGASSAPTRTHIAIEVISAEPKEKVDSLLARAVDHDPWYLAFRDAQAVTIDTEVSEAGP